VPELKRFVSKDPATEPIPFEIVAVRVGSGGKTEQVSARFEGVPAMSFGVLLDDLVRSEGSISATYAFMERALVKDNTDPEDETQARDDSDELLFEDDGETPLIRSEFDRFRAFVSDPELYIDETTFLNVGKWLSEQHAERPTEQPGDSRRTRRAGQRGSAGRR